MKNDSKTTYKNEPIPVEKCLNCGGTIWYYKKEEWRQCIDCSALSTAYGGCYPNLTPQGESNELPADFKQAVKEVQRKLDNGEPTRIGDIRAEALKSLESIEKL